jgi:phosphatidylglycerophosphate synthase
MDRNEIKIRARQMVRPLVLAMDRMGMTPNMVSVIGLLLTFIAAWIVAKGSLFNGAIVLLIGSAFDMLDGDLARLQKSDSRQGAFLDSNFDRLAEGALFAGLAWYFMEAIYPANHGAVLLVVLTLIGSLTTSYARARAEGLGTTCFGGWLQRPERMVLLIAAMLLGRYILELVLLLLAIVTLATSAQRILSVYRNLAEAPTVAVETEEPKDLDND